MTEPAPLTRDAPAKLNLVLRVLSREGGGYHSVETLYCRIRLADTVTARRGTGTGVSLRCASPDFGPPEHNLAVRAAEAVLGAIRTPFAVELDLEKRIPVGAGLGGGSADAAAALVLVNQLAGNAVPRAELFQIAARLGADVPFCLSEASLALAWGRGDRMFSLPRLPPAPILLLKPEIAVSTADAYQWIDAARAASPLAESHRGALLLDPTVLGAWSDVARMAGNDFESVVFARRPQVRDAFEALARTGPIMCRMSGSGSTVFAVYRSEKDRDDARMTLGTRFGTPIASMTA